MPSFNKQPGESSSQSACSTGTHGNDLSVMASLGVKWMFSVPRCGSHRWKKSGGQKMDSGYQDEYSWPRVQFLDLIQLTDLEPVNWWQFVKATVGNLYSGQMQNYVVVVGAGGSEMKDLGRKVCDQLLLLWTIKGPLYNLKQQDLSL